MGGYTKAERRHDRIVLTLIVVLKICAMTSLTVIAGGWTSGFIVLIGTLLLWALTEAFFRWASR